MVFLWFNSKSEYLFIIYKNGKGAVCLIIHEWTHSREKFPNIYGK